MGIFMSIPAMAQDISQIAKSDPLIISGAVGTNNTYYHSSMGNGYASPLTNTVWASLNVSAYGFSMPFSFYYSNSNTSFSYPHFSFNLSPRYKNWTGHIGRSSMPFSSYVMNISFNGIGLEYRDSKFRIGAFYGQLRNAINDNPENPDARQPQYRRIGWGFYAGYGTTRHSLDIYLLRAYDRPGSIDEYWRNYISPQENIVVGLRGRTSPTKWLSFSANAAVSAFTSDTNAPKLGEGQWEQWDKVFEARYTSLARFAGDASMNINLSNFNASLFYRMVQPDYTSMGTYYMSNNYQGAGISINTNLFKKISLSGTFSAQEDNMSRKQLYTTRGFVYNVNMSTSIAKNLYLSMGYNGYLQNQSDGRIAVNDTTRIHRIMHSIYVTPSLSLPGDHIDHMISLSGSYSENKDLNRFAEGVSDVKTLAAGISHSMSVKDWEVSFITSLNHQQSDGYQTRYTSDILSLTADRSFLKEKNLHASATVSVCYNDIKDQHRMLSAGADMSVGYTLKKVHAFSFAAGMNKYSDVNISEDESSYNTTEINMSLNYTYTFTLLEMKKKGEKKEKRKEKK
jgi:hypothetical protein